MALLVKHAFVSAIADSGDATLVQPSNWNAALVVTATANRLIGTSGSTTVTEITVGSGLTLAAGVLSASGGSGSPASPDTSIQFNTGGAFDGSADLLWDDLNTTMYVGSIAVQGTISGATATSTTSNGGNLKFTGAVAGVTSGQGGSFQLAGGAGSDGTGDGGQINILAGSAHTGDAGDVTIGGGNVGVAGQGGSVRIQAGNSNGTGHDGPSLTLIGGYASDATANMGQVNILGDSDLSPTSVPGGIFIAPGTDWNGAASANVLIDLDALPTGVPGNIIIKNLPTSDPGVPGALWSLAGVLQISP